jgi:hypothetical protein
LRGLGSYKKALQFVADYPNTEEGKKAQDFEGPNPF